MKDSFMLTTSQMASIHDINKRTLMYYDNIGLFCPATKDCNGYRYYSYDQCSTLEIILSLRELDVPIPDIMDYMKNRSPVNLLELLEKEEKEALEKIKKLNQIHSFLSNMASSINSTLKNQIGSVSIQEYEEEHLLIGPSINDNSNENIIYYISEMLKQLHYKHLYCYSYGSIMDYKNLLKKEFTKYNRFYLKVPHTLQSDLKFIRPKGTYLQIFWKGQWDTIPDAYARLMDYADKHSIKINSCSYEENVVDDFSTKNENEYITKIMISINRERPIDLCKLI